MLNFISEDSYILIKINRRSTQTDNQVENCCGYNILLMKFQVNLLNILANQMKMKFNSTPFTSSFKIIPSETNGDFIFYTLNNIEFGWQLTIKYIKVEICCFNKKEANI